MVIDKKILILEGGFNEEHKVSLNTSLEVQKVLRKLKIQYKILKVNPNNFEKKISNYSNVICFNALHGPFGENGQIQKILKKNNLRYTHSGIISSKICFNKFLTKKIIIKNKILTPKFQIINKSNLNTKRLLTFKKIFKKFIIKPNSSGSSFGIYIIKNNRDLQLLINNIDVFKKELSFHNKIIVEEYISGKELTVSTINFDNKIKPLGVTEINHQNIFFDYRAKYTKGFAKHILPANISKKIYNKCQDLAVKSHKVLGCKSIARSDFILCNKNKRVYFLETNTQPGLTSISLLPEQAKFENISIENLILGILKKIN